MRNRHNARPPRRRRGAFVSEPLESRRLLNSYIVTTTADSGSTPLSLRQAILDANANSGLDTIRFSIPGSGVHKITPLSALPQITDPVIIDGTTQGTSATPLIQLNGSSAGSGIDGLDISAGGSTVNDLAIGNFSGNGISIFTHGGNLIENCFLGTDPTGTLAAGNGYDGVVISPGSSASANNQITNNLISANGTVNFFPGVQIFGTGSNSNIVSGNKIGTDVTGTKALGNDSGIIVSTAATTNQITGNLISANGPSDGGVGIEIWGTGTNSNVVSGNKIGTDINGTKALGNGGAGVLINVGAQFNRIGTNGDGVNDAGERNIISANGISSNYPGVYISDSGSNNNIVAGNYIGTDISGTLPLGNTGSGVVVASGAQSNRVGVNSADADAAGERNIISANGIPNHYAGVEMFGSGTSQNIVAGNYIGTDVSGLLPLGNSGTSVVMDGAVQNNRIGTNGDGVADDLERNLIVNSGYYGVYLADPGTTGNVIAGNYIGASANRSPMGNSIYGIWVDNGAANNRIGTNGTDVDAAGEGNLITANLYAGILVTDPASGHTTGISIRGNSIHNNNGTMGIDLGNDGANLNHGTALEAGPDNFQNHPQLLSAAPGASANVTGALTALINTSYTLDFYANSAADGPFDGAGDRWLGSATVNTGATGTVSFSANVGTASSGEWITATATDPGGNTSEFSSPIQLPALQLQTNAGSWTPIGPAPINQTLGNAPVVTGRVDVAAADPTNQNVVYIGADDGGVWKTTDWLDPIPQWTPLTDNQPSIQFTNVSYTALVVAPSNSQIIYAAVSWPGGGVLKSTNGGASWTELATSTFNGATFGSIVVDPTNANNIYASVWYGALNGGGVYKSTDGGTTWTNTTSSSHNGSAADLLMDPTNPSTLYTGLVSDTTNGSANNGIYKTTNGGTSWTLLNNGVLSASAIGSSIRLAISPSSPQVLYATVFAASDGLPHRYKTANGGTSWSALSSLPNTDESRYWHAVLSVDPHNSSIVYTNGDHELYESTNGGTTWTAIYGEDPVNVFFDDTSAVIMTGDRGIYRWTGGTSSFQNKHGNLQNTEFYTLTLDPTDPLTVYGIAQDHLAGLKTTDSPIWNYMGGADEVGRVVVDPTNPSTLYEYDPNNGGTAGNGDGEITPAAGPTLYFVWKSTDGGATWTAAGTGIPTTNVGFTLAYTSQRAFEMDPTNHNRLLVGVDSVYETTNGAGSWSAVSPVLSPGWFITDLAIAPSAPSTVYAGTGDGKLFVTTNDSTWTERDSGLPLNQYARVMDIQVDPANSQRAFVVCGNFVGGYSANNHVFETTNGGASWTNITGTLPNDDAGQAICVDWRFATPRLYIGTLRGVFLSTDLGADWNAFGANMPNTIVTDLELSTTFNVLAAATYGRGAFEIRIPASLSNSITGTAVADNITLVQDFDHQHLDWTLGNNAGQLTISDINGLTITGNGGNDSVTLLNTNGSPLPNTIHLNGTFTVTGLTGSNPLANTTLEIGRSTVFISYSSSDPLSLIQGYLKNGYNNGGWNGTPIASTGVITSTPAHNNALQTTAIGYADSADGLISGQPANTIELKYTLYGDTSLAGTVGSNDFTRLTLHYHQTSGGMWDTGDFNYDGSINFNDFTLLTRTYNTNLGSQAAPAASSAAKTAIAPVSLNSAIPPSTGLTMDAPTHSTVSKSLRLRRTKFHRR